MTYPQGTEVQVRQYGDVLRGLVMRDDPDHRRALVRIKASTMRMTTKWVSYDRLVSE